MRELAQKLIHLRSRSEVSALPSAIFGSAGSLATNLENRVPFRIGIWPCVSQDAPEVAMGLMTVLGALLERWHDIMIYPIVVRSQEKEFVWSVAQSQFTVDDYQLDGLDDNIGLWGTLTRIDGKWALEIEVENDFEDEIHAYKAVGASINDLVDQLPQIAGEITNDLNVDQLRVSGIQVYSANPRDEKALEELLKLRFMWEVNLLLYLDGNEWQSKPDHEALVNQAVAVGGELGAWIAATATARAMLPGFDLATGDNLLHVEEVVSKFPDHGFVLTILARSLYRTGEADRAIELLEAEVSTQQDRVGAWLVLADLYRQRGQMLDAVDTYQRAIEADAVNAPLYVNYAVLLPLLETAGWKIEEFILIDPQEFDGNYVQWEAVEAYEEALKLSPANAPELLSQQLSLLIEIDPESNRFWGVFEQLVQADPGGETLHAAVEQFYSIEDLEPAFEIVEQWVKKHPNRADLHVTLAVVYLIGEENDAALEELEKARKLTSEPTIIAEIDRLTLSAEDPEFDARLGEIMDKVGSENRLTTEDVEFLESVVQAAPTYSEVYQLLGRAYVLWGEDSTALETLLDAEKHLPDDVDILEGIARLLWRDNQRELAMQYVKRGLDISPVHIPMLAFAGQALFEDGKEDEARVYLAKAEALAPRHPALERARVRIAQILSEDD